MGRGAQAARLVAALNLGRKWGRKASSSSSKPAAAAPRTLSDARGVPACFAPKSCPASPTVSSSLAEACALRSATAAPPSCNAKDAPGRAVWTAIGSPQMRTRVLHPSAKKLSVVSEVQLYTGVWVACTCDGSSGVRLVLIVALAELRRGSKVELVVPLLWLCLLTASLPSVLPVLLGTRYHCFIGHQIPLFHTLVPSYPTFLLLRLPDPQQAGSTTCPRESGTSLILSVLAC